MFYMHMVALPEIHIAHFNDAINRCGSPSASLAMIVAADNNSTSEFRSIEEQGQPLPIPEFRSILYTLRVSGFRTHVIGMTIFSFFYLLLSGATWFAVYLAYTTLRGAKGTGAQHRVSGFASGLDSNGNGVHLGSSSDLINGNGAATGF